MVFIELPLFQKYLRFSDEELRQLQTLILERPDAGDLLSGGHGLRKLRFPLPGRGKSGGARVIYYWQARQSQCLLIFAYPKNVMDNLSDKQLKVLSNLIRKELHHE
jgi:hypothetical protein